MTSRREHHLSVLGLESGAALAEIRSAYKRLAIKWHPDKNKSAEATSKFQEISHAYTALTDPNYGSDNESSTKFSYDHEGLERFMHLFQSFFGRGDDGPMIIDAWDDDDYGFEPEELFPLQLAGSSTDSLTIDWSVGRIEKPARIIFRLDICSPSNNLPWSACYLGRGTCCKISGLLPGSEYQLRLGVADDCNESMDICSEARCTTDGVKSKLQKSFHPKIQLVTGFSKASDREALSFEWNFNRIAIYEKLVLDPDVDLPTDDEFPTSRRFNLGDDDCFEMAAESGSDDLYEQYLMYSDGEITHDLFCTDDDIDGNVSFFRQMNLGSEFFNAMPAQYLGSRLKKDPKFDKPCRFFQRGACRYGNSCRFSHDPLHQDVLDNESTEEGSGNSTSPRNRFAETRSAPVCRFFRAGNCRRSNCQFSHNLSSS